MREHKFWLVQRLALRQPVTTDMGFDGFFKFEYMGSAEFEYGAPHAALKRMRSAHLTETAFDIDGATVFLITDPATREAKFDSMLDWLTASPPARSKELTRFPEALRGEDTNGTVAWWSFDDDVAWGHRLRRRSALAHRLQHQGQPPRLIGAQHD